MEGNSTHTFTMKHLLLIPAFLLLGLCANAQTQDTPTTVNAAIKWSSLIGATWNGGKVEGLHFLRVEEGTGRDAGNTTYFFSANAESKEEIVMISTTLNVAVFFSFNPFTTQTIIVNPDGTLKLPDDLTLNFQK